MSVAKGPKARPSREHRGMRRKVGWEQSERPTEDR